MIDQKTGDILAEVILERLFQDNKWNWRHEAQREDAPIKWLAVLAEEFGEFATDVNDKVFESGDYPDNMRNELLQIAAVAVAAIEDLDRQYESRSSYSGAESATVGLRDTRVFSN